MLDEKERDDAQDAASRQGEEAQERAPRKAEEAPKGGRLQNALRRARLNESERSDVILELREAESARLEMLYEQLQDVFDDIPAGTDLLECALIPGSPPRLWIDVLAYVAMGRDKRTYRFVKETRYGPKVILETANVEEMAGSVTDYVAHRLLERARALDSDTTEIRRAAERPAVAAPAAAAEAAPAVVVHRGVGWFGVLFAMLVGALLGATALFAYGYYLVSLG